MAKKKIGDYFSGKILANSSFVRRLPLLSYIVFLTMIYITYNFNVQSKYRHREQLHSSIKELRTVLASTTAKRIELTRRSEIDKLVIKFKIGIAPSAEQPEIIE